MLLRQDRRSDSAIGWAADPPVITAGKSGFGLGLRSPDDRDATRNRSHEEDSFLRHPRVGVGQAGLLRPQCADPFTGPPGFLRIAVDRNPTAA